MNLLSAFGALLLLLRLHGLDKANELGGYAAGDQMLSASAARIRDVIGKVDGSAARLGGGIFAAVLADASRSSASTTMGQLLAVLASFATDDAARGASPWLAYYDGSQSAAILLERAHEARRAASQRAADHGQLIDATQTVAGHDHLQQDGRRDILQRVLDERALVLLTQQVRSLKQRIVLHHEVLARIKTGGAEPISPAIFLPMAARVGMAASLDRAVIEAVLNAVTDQPHAVLAVNLARDSVDDEDVRAWLSGTLQAQPEIASRPAFEVSEDMAAVSQQHVLAFAAMIRATGAFFGVDHCGARNLGLDYLRAIQPNHVKIDGVLISQVMSNADIASYVHSLVGLVHGLDAAAIAEHVETEEQMKVARDLELDGAQGCFVHRPDALEAGA